MIYQILILTETYTASQVIRSCILSLLLQSSSLRCEQRYWPRRRRELKAFITTANGGGGDQRNGIELWYRGDFWKVKRSIHVFKREFIIALDREPKLEQKLQVCHRVLYHEKLSDFLDGRVTCHS